MTPNRLRLLPLIGTGLLAGCHPRHEQSALHPAGPAAAEIAWLWWFLFFVLTAVFVLVIIAMLVAIARPRGTSEMPLGNRFIVVSGIILPAIILVVLLFFSLHTTISLNATAQGLGRTAPVGQERGMSPPGAVPQGEPLTVRVIGHQWWWEVEYPEQERVPDEPVLIANEIYIPAGEPVRFLLRAHDVIHSFWVPNLHGKMDMLPEVDNVFWLQADRPGRYRGQCAEFCGEQHALMAFWLIAVPPDEFRDWVAARQRPHPEPEPDSPEDRGREAFFEVKCHNCHRIRGTRATGRIGPDLTHIHNRRTIGAGWIANNHGNLSGWIVNPQEIKPGNRMPRTFIDPGKLHDLMAYLESLE